MPTGEHVVRTRAWPEHDDGCCGSRPSRKPPASGTLRLGLPTRRVAIQQVGLYGTAGHELLERRKERVRDRPVLR